MRPFPALALAGLVLPVVLLGAAALPVPSSCDVGGPGGCVFACAAGDHLRAVAWGHEGASYALTCGDVSWTCTQQAPYLCGLASPRVSDADPHGRCIAHGPSIRLVCSASAVPG